ncbi:MAG: PD40 domain-containing protein [Candidatus Zixiibacteriota bacterium]|nr:MAG: PD40 domain-containing protein [candidate division Zixibacteria bacterium]
MMVLRNCRIIATSILGLLLIFGCNDNRLAPVQTQDQATLAMKPPEHPTKIVFKSNRDGNLEIYTMNADGTEQTNVTNYAGPDEAPCWSPGGQKIAFISNRDDEWGLYIQNADGTGLTCLVPEGEFLPWYPHWSADGEKIVFAGFYDYETPDQNNEIFVINVDGTGLTRLTYNPASDGAPCWSPNGRKIAFLSTRDGNSEVYVMNADGTEQTNLTNCEEADDGRPDWSPDGKKIAFDSNRYGRNEIFVMNADGSEQICLTDNPARKRRAAWSPCGKMIAFESYRSGDSEIYVINADGTGQTQITDNSSNETWVDWVRVDN